MGKGDKKSRKGKIAMGSFGVLRPNKKAKAAAKKNATPAKKIVKSEKVAAPVKKVVIDEKAAAPKKVAAPKKPIVKKAE